MSESGVHDIVLPVESPLAVNEHQEEIAVQYHTAGMSGIFETGSFIEHDVGYMYDSRPSVVTSHINSFGIFHGLTNHQNNVTADLLHGLSGTYSSQVLLGIVAFSEQPKPTARQQVSQLHASGIRFVYFSPDSERLTHAFGSSLGLFTGFNHYISLRPPMDTDKEELYLGSSLLPRGVLPQRIHIDFIDNVPLLVSLLSDSGPETIQGMLRVYGEQGEECVGFGSSLSWQFSSSFQLSALSFSIDPVLSAQCRHHPPAPRVVPALPLGGERQTAPLATSYASAVAAVTQQAHTLPATLAPPQKEPEPASLLRTFEFGLATALTSAASTIRLPTEFTLTDFSVQFSYARSFDAAAIRAFDAQIVCLVAVLLTCFIGELVNQGAPLTIPATLLLCFACLPLLLISLVLIPKDPASIDHICAPRSDGATWRAKTRKQIAYILTIAFPVSLVVNVFFWLLIRDISVDLKLQHTQVVTLQSGPATLADNTLTVRAQDFLFWSYPAPVVLSTVNGPVPISLSFLLNSVIQSKRVRLAQTVSALLLWVFFLGTSLVMGLRASDVAKKTKLQVKSHFSAVAAFKCTLAFRHFYQFLPQWLNLAVFSSGLILQLSVPTFVLGDLDGSSYLFCLIPGVLVALLILWELACRIVLHQLRKEEQERQITFFQFDTQLGMHSPVGH